MKSLMHSLTARPFLAQAMTVFVFLLAFTASGVRADTSVPALSTVTDCNECTTKVVSLTLRFEGDTAKRIIVQTRNADDVYFDAVVQPGATFSFTGDKKDNAFGDNNLEFIILDENSNFKSKGSDFGDDSDLNVIEFHVSCSKPVVIGMDAAQQDEWDDGDEDDSVSNDADKGRLFVAGATQKDGVTLCAPPTSSDEAFCYLIADNDGFKSGSADGLTFLDGSFNEFFIGNTGTPNTEGLTLVPETGILYGSDANELVTINTTTGAATVVGSFGSANGEFGTISLSDVDGLAWDPFQDIMFAVSRRSGEDVLFQVDVSTGNAIQNAFGPGVDYVGVDAINNLDDVDDLAISTRDGKVYAIQNENGQDSRLILINKTTGQTTDLGDLDVQNVEGLGFHPDGRLLGITGDSFRSVIEISYAPFSSTTTQISSLGVNGFGDYEGIACLTESDNMIMGSVFVDPSVIDLQLEKAASVSTSPTLDTIEYTVTLTNDNTESANTPQAVAGVAAAGVSVELHRDLGVIGTWEPGTDVLVATTTTAGDGTYGFDVSANGDFLVRVDLASVTNLAVTPSDNVETMSFVGFGEQSDNHDFHFTTFTTATGVTVADTFPANATFVSASTASGSFNNGTKVWTPGNLAPGASATLTINATTVANGIVENCAEVMTANQPDIDSTPGNGAGEDDQDCVPTEHEVIPAECTPDLDFETDAAGNSLPAGTIITNQYAAWGVTVTTHDPVNHPAMLFDSANPTGDDPDLGAPNTDFSGPGVGSGGGTGQPGINNGALGNVLIISEDGDTNDPDDNSAGGTLIFTFDDDTNLAEVHILDVDNIEVAGVITAYDGSNNVIETQQILALGDNSLQVVPFSATGVRRLEIELPGSGAVARIVTCADDPVQLGSIGDTVFLDSNNNGVQDPGENGIPGVELELFTNNGAQLVDVAVTDANGMYLFDNLPAGSYTVDPDGTTAPANHVLTTANDPMAVALSSGEHFLDADFGYVSAGNPDVRVNKTASAASAGLGDTFTYTLTATNGGAVPATGVELTDTLPFGLAYVSANPAAGIAYDSNTHTITWTVGTLAVGASVNVVITVEVDWMSGTYTGAFLGDGVYKLNNHPDGNVRPPYYGLRLDKLFGGVTPVTFDFEHAQSDMRMRIEDGGTKVVLYGQVWGGKDNGSSYDFAGVWKVQMVYNGTVSTVPGDDDLYVTAESDFGTIVPQYTTAHFSAGQVFQLVPKSDGNFSFRLGNEDNDNGHRGFDGISGWGWLNHNGDGDLSTHKSSSDWLFTATPAPDSFDNCVAVSAMNEPDGDTSNDEACVQTPPLHPGTNALSGTVFIDANQDSFLSGGESGQGGVTVNVYSDLNGNGVKDGGEPLFDSTVTAGDGTYMVLVPTVGHFVIESDFPGSYPASAVMTTDNVELSYFPAFGLTDPDNNFGFYVPTGTPGVDIEIEKTGDLGSADLGDTVTYTLTASNLGNDDATGVVVTDTLPYGVAFTGANPAAGISYDANSHTVTWTIGALASGASTDVDLTVDVDWMTGTFTGSFLQDGYYRLNNHPVHGQALPNYGLRLDQLFGQTGPITFDFEHAQSDMRMRIENGGTKVTIFGTTWGGIDAGSSYTDDGLWELYFQYNGTVQGAPGDDDLLSYTETDNGSIRALYSVPGQFNAGDVYALVPKSDGNFAFRLGNEDDDNGWRAFDGISGWGWLDHDGPGTLDHYSASDWGFTASPAPSELENCVALSDLDQTDVNAANNEDCFVTTTPPTTEPGVNLATGVVFFDADQDGVRDAGEPGQENVTVTVYRDLNSNGFVDGGDTVFSTYVTPANGFYAAFIPEIGDFVITTDFPGTYPGGSALTTDNVETAVFASYGNIDSGNDFGFYAAGLVPDIDLSLEKTASEQNVQLNDTFTYTLTLRNSSLATQAATGIEVWDTMPAGIDVLTTTPSTGVLYNSGTGALKWSVASLAPGAELELTIEVRAEAEGTMVNCAQVGTATGIDADSTPGNGEPSEDDQDCATVEVSNGPVTGSIGDLVFQDVNNNGTWDAGEPGLGGVLVRLYAGVCGPTGTPIALRTTQANGAYLFTGLPAGSYCVDVRDDTVPFGYVLSTGNDPLTVNLTSGENFDDADFGYYYDPQLTTVDLELVKEVNTSSPALNENVTFTITIRNQGPGTATNVIVRDIIPVGLQFVEANASVGGYEATKLGYWTIGTLEPGQTEVLTITTTVVITNMIENIAQVVAVDQPDIDSTPGNGVPSEDDQDNAIVESRGPGAAGDITRAECADIGTINSMLYEPNANIVLAGSEVGSVHISNDQGQNWPVYMQANNSAPISDIVATANGSAIYVGTFGDGVWRSTDGGDTWSKYKLGTNTVNDLDLDENNNVLYAAVDKKVMTIDLGTGSTATIAGDPFNDQVLTVVYDENTDRVLAASAAAGAWKYESGSWTDVNSGLPIGKINAMIVTPAGAVLAGTNSDGVYVFGGGGWFQYGMGLDGEPVESLGLGGNGEILAGARESGAYYFNQLSGEWESIGNLPIFTVASMTAGAQGEVYAGAPGEGIYVIYDTNFDGIPDQAHQVANFMTSAVIQDMVVAPNGDIYAASYGYGVLYSSDGGNCWTRMNRGLENLWTFAIARKTDGTLFIGIWADGKGGIWRSTDEGRNWEFLAYPTRQIISLAVDPNNEDIIYAGANLAGEGSIVMSTDGGDSWTQLQSFIQPVWSIQIDPNNSDRVVVGTLGDGVYESLDQGATWNQIGSGSNGLTDANGFDLKFGPTGHLYAATNRGVYRYDDQGGFPTYSWSLYGIGSEDYQMRTIEFVGSDIYAGTWNAGLIMYDSGTGEWTDLGLGDIPVIAFAVHQASQTLVIGTNGSGVFLNANIGHSISTSVEDELVSDELPTGYSLEQNYPNPFNPQTTIPFSLVKSGNVRMAVYDVLGREVSLLIDGAMQAGQHRVTWDAAQLPTGNYLVRLEAAGQVMTRSMVLMK